MRKLVIFSLVVLILALNCKASEPVQLTGANAKSILAQVASTNITTQVTKASPSDLGNWGKIPLNYELNQTGKIVEASPGPDDYDLWLETKSDELGGLDLKEFS